jgi:hypothetical protein
MRELALDPATRAETLSGVRRSIKAAVAIAAPFLLAAFFAACFFFVFTINPPVVRL